MSSGRSCSSREWSAPSIVPSYPSRCGLTRCSCGVWRRRLYPPPVALLWHFLTPSNFLLAALVGPALVGQTFVLVRLYAGLVRDRHLLQAEVMHEYNAKFVNVSSASLRSKSLPSRATLANSRLRWRSRACSCRSGTRKRRRRTWTSPKTHPTSPVCTHSPPPASPRPHSRTGLPSSPPSRTSARTAPRGGPRPGACAARRWDRLRSLRWPGRRRWTPR